MADIEITRRHSFAQDDALAKLKNLLGKFQGERPDFIKNVDFSGNQARATGKHFEGMFEAHAAKVTVTVELTGFSGFSGRAKKAAIKPIVKSQIEKALDNEFPA